MIPQIEQNSLRGSVDIILRDANGKIVKRHQCKNLITSSGKVLLANIFRGMEKQGVTHIGVGTNTTRPSPVDDSLGEELLPRKAFDQNLIQEEANASLILNDKKGAPFVKLYKKELKGVDIKISLSHCEDKATAFAVAIKSKNNKV